MFIVLRLIQLPDDRLGELPALLAALNDAAPQLPGQTDCWIAPIPARPVINAGHIVWRTRYQSEGLALRTVDSRAWRARIAPLIADVDVTTIGYRISNSAVRRTGAGIWRALIFRTFPHAELARIRQMEAATLTLPRYVDAIKSWALSRVAFTQGEKGFTHVWEQEFDSVDGLTGPYMTDPAHWGIADAYFDAEYPEYIVDPQLIQVVGTVTHSIIPPVGPQLEIWP